MDSKVDSRVGELWDDPAFIDAFRAGQPEALEKVYLSYARPVERCLRALARARGVDFLQQGAIADFVQETFIRAFSSRARHSYDGVRDYEGYLKAIARNCFISAVRTRGREVLCPPKDLLGRVEPTPTDEEGPSHARTLSVLTDYVNSLSDDLSAIYRQRFVHGHSQRTASETLRLSRQSLRTAETHLRNGLRTALVKANVISADHRTERRRPRTAMAV